MSIVKILNETEDTVTISRDDWQRLQDQLEDAGDRSAIAKRRAHEQTLGSAAARRSYLTADETLRLLNGVSPLKVWREKRGLSQRALAKSVGVASSYLAEIETHRKPGSGDAYRKLAAALQVPPDELDARRYRTRDPRYGRVRVRLTPALASMSAGSRGIWADLQEFDTLQDALTFVRDAWPSLRLRAPWIADEKNWPIYDSEELAREIEEQAAGR